MTQILQGVRILEVAEHTFVPAASALLADWGAEVIKIEHVERGDAMRGSRRRVVVDIPSDVHVLLEHSNRGKQSLALDLTSAEGLDILYRLAATSDVFLTNKLPGVRKKLKIDVEDIRAHNPDIIYARGTGQGERGPDADKGSYDSLAFWNRSGAAVGSQRSDDDIPLPPAPGFGDSIGAMTIAGGIMGALFHRERTGEATVVDVSLLGTGCGRWARRSRSRCCSTPPGIRRRGSAPGPIHSSATTGPRTGATCRSRACRPASTGRTSATSSDSRSSRPTRASPTTLSFGTTAPRRSTSSRRPSPSGPSTSGASARRLRRPVGGRPAHARGGGRPAIGRQRLRAGMPNRRRGPVPARRRASSVRRRATGTPSAPEFNEHGDAILAELGLDWDTIVDLKVRGVVA